MTILSMVKMKDFKLDSEDIQKILLTGNSIEEIEEAIKVLLENNLISYDLNGKVISHFDEYITKSDISIPSTHQYYRNVFRLADHAIEEDIQKREFQCFSFCLKNEDIHSLKKLLRSFRERLAQLENSEGDVVYQVNLQGFPVTNDLSHFKHKNIASHVLTN
jgi:uncharacterized protein (TIGR02147 family)